MSPLGASSAESLGAEPERLCRQFSDGLRRCLQWHADQWLPLEEELNEAGLRFRQLLEEQPPEVSIGGELLRMAGVPRASSADCSSVSERTAANGVCGSPARLRKFFSRRRCCVV